jgi:hypothetical protein
MATKILRPAGAGTYSGITLFSSVSVLADLSDNSDLTYVEGTGATDGDTLSTFTLEAHGLNAGDTINSVTLYYRGESPAPGKEFTGAYYFSTAPVTDDARDDGSVTEYSLPIPAPGGTWSIAELESLEIGAWVSYAIEPFSSGKMCDVWLVVDYTEEEPEPDPEEDDFIPHVQLI